ncbi:MAG: hypothetical protein ACYCWE_02675 [Eubacteriales bacterium]
MSYNTKNYTEPGGEKTVIGGTLEVREGALITGLTSTAITAATETVLGGIKAAAKTEAETVPVKIGLDSLLYVPASPVAVNQAASTANTVAGLLADLNALLVKLKAAGLMTDDT